MKRIIFILFIIHYSSLVIPAQWMQQGQKLVGTNTNGNSSQGNSVAISADGSTLIEGGWEDNSRMGAVWVFTRINGVWLQQGTKLVGTGAVGDYVYQGFSVAISSDGNTAIVSGSEDNFGTGAVWIFIRSGDVWTQQGPKLVGTGAVGQASQGSSVAISSSGNIAIIGGYEDNNFAGAFWIFTRNGAVWTQLGSKLVGSGSVGKYVYQGWSIGISSDGTIIEGGSGDNNNTGAVWIFIRSGSVWTQQGTKLIGTDTIGSQIYQGNSVAISSDGNTAIEGGSGDNNNTGAVWIFSRNGNVWTQQGPKLVGSGSIGNATQGQSVAISTDGNTAIESSNIDNNYAGAIWVFTRSGNVWSQQGPKYVGSGAIGSAHQGQSIAISSGGNTFIEGGFSDNGGLGAIWVFVNPSIGIQPISNIIPKSFSLSQNYPNPFNPTTKIKFDLSKSNFTLSEAKGLNVQLKIYDILGKEVAILVNESLKPGTYEVEFNAANYPSGVYFYKLGAGEITQTKKMLVVK